jgi:adenosylhomocysteine nucleosidase
VKASRARSSFVLAVSGLAREAAIAAGPGVRTVAGAGERIERLIESAVAQGAAGILSFGIAGGLDPALAPGTCILAREVIAANGRWAADPAWRSSLAARLPRSVGGDLAGVTSPALSPADKRELRAATGASAVDMESHIAARAAAVRRLPFAVLRVVCDPAERALPAAALAGVNPDGRTDAWAVLRLVLASPRQLSDLFRLAGDARHAFSQLRRARAALEAGLGFPDFTL